MSSSATALPPLSHVLETCLYVRDLEKSARFYREALNIEPFMQSQRMAGFSLGTTTLLIFQLGLTASDIHTPTGLIPGHGPTESVLSSILPSNRGDDNDDSARLKQHFCVAVKDPDDVVQWDQHLQNQNIRILGRMDWELGGKSVYFEDPDGHVGEIDSKGIWKHY